VKCIKRPNGDIERVPDFQAVREVKEGRASFIAKLTWKQLVRDPEREEVDKRILAKLSKGTLKVGDKLKFHVEGRISESSVAKDGTLVIKGMEVTGVGVSGSKVKAKDRRKAERKHR
jgi:hypothetical protein